MAKRTQKVITSGEIVAGLRRLGLRRGDRLVVHSSLSSFGHVEGGAYAVIEALQVVVGPEGTLLVPTFNHGQADVFDTQRRLRRTAGSPRPSATWKASCGQPPDARLRRLGRRRGALPPGRPSRADVRAESPLGRLIADGGWVLLLGVTTEPRRPNTTARLQPRQVRHAATSAGAQFVDDEGEVTATVVRRLAKRPLPLGPARARSAVRRFARRPRRLDRPVAHATHARQRDGQGHRTPRPRRDCRRSLRHVRPAPEHPHVRGRPPAQLLRPPAEQVDAAREVGWGLPRPTGGVPTGRGAAPGL